MRSPLPAFQAFAQDARARSSNLDDRDVRLADFLAVTKVAEQLSTLDPFGRRQYLEAVADELLPASDVRPTLVHDVQPRPEDPLARLSERLRLEAEQMERSGCFEMAFATLSAVCQMSVHADLTTRMTATVHLGRVARQLGDFETATDCYSTVTEESLRERDGPLAALGFIGLGVIANNRGNRPAERAMFERALSLAHPGGIVEASASQGLMNVAIAEHRHIDALLHGWRAFDLATDISETRAMILSNLALTSFHADFTAAALGGFMHVLTLTNTARIRLPAIAGAMRAAARLREDREVVTLNAQGDRETIRAALPFESARFLLHAGEAWATVGDRDFARRRYQDALAMAVQHGFFEIRVKAEDALDALQRTRIDVPQANLTASSVTSDPEAEALVAAGIGRLEALRG
jgi:tetratricopeptide (TPR) repeat protein